MGDGLWHCLSGSAGLRWYDSAKLLGPKIHCPLHTSQLQLRLKLKEERQQQQRQEEEDKEEQQAGYVHCVHLIMDTSSDFLANGIYTKCIKMYQNVLIY